jgi:hypothetical protein
VGIGVQQAQDRAREFRIAAVVNLLRITEIGAVASRREHLAPITLCYRQGRIVRRSVKTRDGNETAIAEHVHQNFHPNGHWHLHGSATPGEIRSFLRHQVTSAAQSHGSPERDARSNRSK